MTYISLKQNNDVILNNTNGDKSSCLVSNHSPNTEAMTNNIISPSVDDYPREQQLNSESFFNAHISKFERAYRITNIILIVSNLN